MKKKIAALLLIALIVLLPASALAAKYSISFPGKVGFMYEGASVTVRPQTKGIRADWLTWTTSNAACAAVEDGRINALECGRAVISASCKNLRASFGVVVLPRTVNLTAGETYQLPYGTVERYSVQDAEVAAVSAKGLITAKEFGSTNVYVQYRKQKMCIEVNVSGSGAEAADSKAAFLPCATETNQIVLVEHKGGSEATLSVHEKRNGAWAQLYECAACVGKNGIGKTKEGDGRTPSGIFNLTTPFGIKNDPGANMKYTKVTKYHYWCGSSGSDYYNQLVDSRATGRKCTSSDEKLIEYGKAYNYCMFIDYNAKGVADRGSCIFLHCKSGSSTAGCVSVAESVMKKIVQWAKPGCKIVIM